MKKSNKRNYIKTNISDIPVDYRINWKEKIVEYLQAAILVADFIVIFCILLAIA